MDKYRERTVNYVDGLANLIINQSNELILDEDGKTQEYSIRR